MQKIQSPDIRYAQTFLTRLQPEHFKIFQEMAAHHLGRKTRFEGASRTLPTKVLPGAFEDILRATNPAQVVQAIQSEARDHKFDPLFHSGGGIWDAVKSLGYWGANLARSYFDETGWFTKAWDYMNSHKTNKHVPTDTRKKVDLLMNSMNKEGSRGDTAGFKHLKQFDSNYTTVYLNEAEEEIVVSIRGTDDSLKSMRSVKDLYKDAKIAVTGKAFDQGVVDVLRKVEQQYGNKYDLTCEGFSLGGTLLTSIFTNPEYDSFTKEYDSLLLVEPGASPLAGHDQIKKILADSRTTLMVNRQDPISLMYAGLSHKERTFYGDDIDDFMSLEAHKLDRWGSEFNKGLAFVPTEKREQQRETQTQVTPAWGHTPVEYEQTEQQTAEDLDI